MTTSISDGVTTYPVIITEYRGDIVAESTVHPIIGRPDPLIGAAPAATRAGTFTIVTGTHATAKSIAGLHSGKQITLVTDHPGMGMKYWATRCSITPWQRFTTGWQWHVDIDFVEVL